YRRRRILDEIAFYTPDFVCLQELPPSDFKEFFLSELQKIGYDGHFQAKKKEHAADGCAIFYLEQRFTLMAVQAFAYADQINDDPNSDLASRLAPFPNIALVCVFQNRQARSLRVRVVNTHLHWDPAFADTKLLQAAILMEWLERTHRDVPTVIAADLNSRAGEAVVDYLVRGKVAPGALFGDKDFGRFTASLVTRVAGGGVVPFSQLLAAGYVPPQQPASTPTTPQTASVDQLGTSLPTTASGAATQVTTPGFPMSLPNGAGGPLAAPGGPVVGSAPNGLLPLGASPLPLLRHGTKLASAYDRKDLPFTNKTPDFEGSIDHILYTSGTLSIRDVLADLDAGPLGNQSVPVYPLSALGLGAALAGSLGAGNAFPMEMGLGLTPSITVKGPADDTVAAAASALSRLNLTGGGGVDGERLTAGANDESTTPRSGSPSDQETSPQPGATNVLEGGTATGTDTADSITPPASAFHAQLPQNGLSGAVAPGMLGQTNPLSPNVTALPYPAPPQHTGYFSRVASLPTEHFPSDHIPLVAWLKWKTVPVGTGPSLGSSLGGGGGGGGGGNANGVEMRSRPRGGRRGGGGGGGGGGPNNGMYPGGGGGLGLLSTSAPGRSGLPTQNAMSPNPHVSLLSSSTAGVQFGSFDNRPPLPGGGGASLLSGQQQGGGRGGGPLGSPSLLNPGLMQQRQQQQGGSMNGGYGVDQAAVAAATARKYSLPAGIPQPMMGPRK
ncbi:Glucose-repressible alcohol dehydrogenase transcriptional effector, partial [Phlyctochytrium bullatum]